MTDVTTLLVVYAVLAAVLWWIFVRPVFSNDPIVRAKMDVRDCRRSIAYGARNIRRLQSRIALLQRSEDHGTADRLIAEAEAELRQTRDWQALKMTRLQQAEALLVTLQMAQRKGTHA